MVKRLFVVLIIVFLSYISCGESGPKIDSDNGFYERVFEHSCRDCGVNSLIVTCNVLGIETITFDKMSNLFKSRNEVTMYDLYKIVTNEGLSAQWIGLSMDELSNINTPSIVCTTDKHFIVVDKIVGDNVQIIDYEICYLLSKEEFQKVWDGCALILSKIDEPIQQRY